MLADEHTHAVSADRVVNVDETSCRLLLVHQIGWGRRGVKQAQLQGNTREATTFMFASSIGPWHFGHAGCRSCTRARQTPSCRSSPGRSTLITLHVTEWLGHDDHDPAAHVRPGRRDELGQGRTIVDPSGHEGHFTSRRAVLHPRRTALRTCSPVDLAVFLEVFKSSIQTEASARLLPRSVHRRLIRRHRHEQGMAATQASAEWASRAVVDFRDKNHMCCTSWGPLRAHSDADVGP